MQAVMALFEWVDVRVTKTMGRYGIVLLRMNFGPGSTFDGPNELDVWEAFKIYDGQIQAVEAYMEVVPSGTKSGWE